MTKRVLAPAILAAVLSIAPRSAYGAAVLHVCPEGGIYINSRDACTCLPTPKDTSCGDSLRLWAIGNLSALGPLGAIGDVRLAVAFSQADLGLMINIAPSFEWRPFGLDVAWQEGTLSDSWTCDTLPGDFLGCLAPAPPAAAEINLYILDISVVGGAGARLPVELPSRVRRGGQERPRLGCVAAASWAWMNIAPEPPPQGLWALLVGLTWAGSAWMFRYLARWQAFAQQEPAPAVASKGGRDYQGAAPLRALPAEVSLRGNRETLALLQLQASLRPTMERAATPSKRRPR